jgi:hypothetical protein
VGLCVAALLGTAGAQPAPERRLVNLRSVGPMAFAEADPAFDYTVYLPRRYNLFGLDPALIRATASSAGLPSRLLGLYSGDRVEVPRATLRTEPPLLPLSLNAQSPWRGVVLLRQRGNEMAVTPGQWQRSVLEAGTTAPRDGLYRVTAWTTRADAAPRLTDLTFVGPGPLPGRLDGPLVAVISEGFLERSFALFRAAHPQQFAWSEPSNTASFELENLGLTTLGGSVRVFATLSGHLAGLGKLVQGEWEAPLQVTFEGGWARLSLLPQGQQARLVRPFFAEVPGQWSDAIASLINRFFASQWAVPVPGAYLQQLLATNLVTAEELARLQLQPSSWGDRRSGSLLLQQQGSTAGGPPLEVGRIPRAGFALGVSAAALNRCLSTWLPAQLPLKADLPADRVPSPQVLIFKLRLRQLEVQKARVFYQEGRFHFEDAELAVHWSLGPVSGVEPGARVSGYAVPALSGKPARMAVQMTLTKMEFLSPQILKSTPAEQARLRQQILDGLQTMPLPLPVTPELKTEVHPGVPLELTSLRCEPERVWLEGAWAR